MAIKKVKMKLAITSSDEINTLMKFLNELDDLYKYELKHLYLKDIDLSEFEILKTFDSSDPEQFLSDILKHLSNIHFQRILWNADAMLKNCADLQKNYLDFNPDIKKGLELLKEKSSTSEKIKR